MLEIDKDNSYLLLYRTTKFLDCFSEYEHVEEILLKAPSKLVWDQVAVPYIAWKKGADIIYNPKFSIPLVSHCPVAMGLQEPAWWAWPDHYEWLDVRYIKVMLPLYCRKATHFFPWSQFTIDENRKYLGFSFENSTITYAAPNEYFRPIDDHADLEEIREKYQLPEKFILGVTRVDHPGLEQSTSFYSGKNVEITVKAFTLIRERIPHKLVVAGRRVREYLLHTGWTQADLEGIHFTDFVPHQELPGLYSSAELFVIPSFYESFGFTLVEAMACGCPVVASQTGACPEISGGAALLADPHDPADFADKIMSVINNEELRQEMKVKSLERASFFSWERTARLTLEGLTRAVEA
jgi:glycosyltransferase involved in cell wall biosynthesis